MTAISNGGAAQRVKVLQASDLKANGGAYSLEGRPPIAVYGVTEVETTAQGGDYVVMGNVAQPVYVVDPPDGVGEATIAPIPMIAVDGALAVGNVAIPVYVVGGSLPSGGGSTLNTQWIASYTLDEAAGAVRVDSVGGNDLSESGGSNNVGSVAGIHNNAASFTAANNRRLQSSAFATLTVVSISAWVYFPSSGGTGMFTLEGAGAGVRAYRNGSDQLQLAFAGGADIQINGLTEDTWHHVFVGYDSATQTGYGSVDGGTIQTGLDVAHNPNLTTPVLSLGITEGIAWGTLDIDQMDLWDRILTQDEVDEIFNGGAGKFPPW